MSYRELLFEWPLNILIFLLGDFCLLPNKGVVAPLSDFLEPRSRFGGLLRARLFVAALALVTTSPESRFCGRSYAEKISRIFFERLKKGCVFPSVSLVCLVLGEGRLGVGGPQLLKGLGAPSPFFFWEGVIFRVGASFGGLFSGLEWLLDPRTAQLL